MSIFNVLGPSTTLFTAFNTGTVPAALTGRLLYVNATEFGYTNEDGSTTYVKGTGFAWDKAAKVFTSGEVTSITHYVGGQFHDNLLTIPPGLAAAALQAMLEQLTLANPDALSDPLLAGDDILDGRGAPGGTPVSRDLDGKAGDDLIRGGGAGDRLAGSSGDDRIFGNSGSDIISGGSGGDFARGGSGNDTIAGGAGGDRLRGGYGADEIAGGGGDDRLHGGSSHDILTGGGGDDRMTGGNGRDTFVFEGLYSPAPETENSDVITDFAVGKDILFFANVDLEGLNLSATPGGVAVVSYDDGFNQQTIKLLGIMAASVTLDDLIA